MLYTLYTLHVERHLRKSERKSHEGELDRSGPFVFGFPFASWTVKAVSGVSATGDRLFVNVTDRSFERRFILGFWRTAGDEIARLVLIFVVSVRDDLVRNACTTLIYTQSR